MNVTKSLSFLFLAGILTAAIGFLPLINSNNALAQTDSTSGINTTNMTGGDNIMMNDNHFDKSMYGKEHQKYEKINGTLNMMETMYQAIGEKINVTLTEAILTAEQSVGNGTMAMSANGAEKDGFLVFEILLGSPDMKFTKVLVDSGNGQVLQIEPVSVMEWMMMMHSQGHGDYGTGMKGMHSGDGRGGTQGSGW